MPNLQSTDIDQLQRAYAAFNARDAESVLATMTPDVTWPRAFKGGFVQGPAAIRAYWAEQWAEIDAQVNPITFHPLPDGRIAVRVHQVVRDLTGTVLVDTHVGHCFTLESGLICAMELCDAPDARV